MQCAKPMPSAGECKTDVYVLAEDTYGRQKEFKISVKQSNADFLENKIKLERAIEIFGPEAPAIIQQSVAQIKNIFEQDDLVSLRSYKKNVALVMKLGWRFECINKKSGKKCGKLVLTDSQKVDVYAGTNMNVEKKKQLCRRSAH